MKGLIGLFSVLATINTTTPNSITEASIDITEMNIEEIQEAVDDGYLTYEKIMNIYLERIDEYNEKYNAILYINKDAIEEAKKADVEYKKNGRKSMLFGLPIVVKDNIDVKGMPTTGGTKALKDNYPKNDAPAIKNIKDAGGIIIGKTNMSEFALSAYNSHSSYGHVRNAYNTSYSSYGSSGGTAVAVAANFAVAGLGTDTGGSVRLPSSANNLIGIRPTWGSISGDGVIKYDKTRDTIGPITRYVEDNAILLDILQNKDKKYENTTNKTQSLKGLRIGVATQLTNGKVTTGIQNLFNKTLKNMKSLGAEVVYVNDFYNGYYSFNRPSFCYDFNEYLKGTTGTIRSFQELKKNGGYVSDMSWVDLSWCSKDYIKSSQYATVKKGRDAFTTYVNNKFKKYNLDVVVYPNIRESLYSVYGARHASRGTYAYVITATGFPTMSIQMGKINGLPYGMDVVAVKDNEQVLYKLAYNYQEKTNYYNNPSISKNLYVVSEELNKIKNKKNENKDKYKDIDKISEEYIENYDEKSSSNLKESLILSMYELIDENESD